ncbi:MAG: sensor histidine kinase lipoprotein [Anaerolineaceae bacterium]|nr:MAG: sensor histidine kinase lipoprotein [Anaerolineaceae bacterium]
MKTHSKQTIQNKFTSSPRRWAVVSAAIVLAVSLFVWRQANQWYQTDLLTNQRSQIEDNLIPYENALSSVLNRRFTLLEGLAAFVKISPTDAELRSKFTPFASGLCAGKPDIRAIQIFPKEGAVLVYPIEGNEATIGRTLDDLINDDRPDVRADIQRTIQTHQIAISGPYELRQGGLGMVARLAIYRGDTLLGIAVIVLDMPPLLEAGGLANPQPHIRLALKDSSGQILTGSEDVFSDNPVIYTIVLPDGEWELAAMPPDGWTASIRNSLRIFQWTGLLIIALATSLAYLITNRQARLTLAVQEQTASLTVSIAKHKQANEALRESEQYNRMLFDSSPIGLALCRMDGSLVDVNPAYVRILGRTVKETLTLTYWDITPKEYADQEALQLESLEKTGRYGPYEKEYIHKDGRRVPVRLQGLIIEKDNQRFIWSSVEDITERKQAENTLREAELRYRSIFEQTHDAIFILDLQGRHIDANQRAADMLGYTLDELQKLSVNETSAEMAESSRIIKRLVAGEHVPLYERLFKKKSGEVFPAEINVELVRDADGSSLHIQSVVRDITERKRAEEALRRSEAHLEEAQRIAHLGSWDWIAATDTPMWSKELCAILEVDPDKPVPSLAEQDKLYTPDSMERMRKAVEITMQTGAPYEIELERVREDGSRRWLLARGERWFDEKGQLIGLRGTALNITERKQMEEAEREQRQLAEALRDTAAALNSTLNLDEVIERILENVGRVIPYDTVDFTLLEGQVGRVLRGRGYKKIGFTPQAVTALSFPLKDFATLRMMLESGQALAIPETEKFPGWVVLPGLEKLKSYLGAPIRNREGTVTGFLTAGNMTPGFYNDAHAARLQAFANQAAIAIQNARLLEETRQRMKQLAALNALGNAVSATLSLEETSAAAVKGMLEAVHPDLAFLFLREGDKLILKGIAPKKAAKRLGAIPNHRVGECMCGLAVSLGKPLYSRDIFTDMRCTWEECKKAGFRSFAALPLRSGTEIIGVVGLASDSDRDFEPQAEFLETLTSQVSIALENARLFEENKRKLEMLNTLYSGARQLAESLDLEKVAARVARTCVKDFGVKLAWLLRAEPDGSTRSLTHHPGRIEYPAKAVIRWDDTPQGQGPAGRAIRSRQPVVNPDLNVTPDFAPWRAMALAEGFVTSGAFPMVSGNRSIGVLSLYSDQLGFFSAERVDFFHAFAAQAAAALENARLFGESQRRAHHMELLNGITQASLREKNLPAMLQTLADRLGEMLDADGCYITLWDEAQQKTIPAAAFGAFRATYPAMRPQPGEKTLTASVMEAGHALVVEDAFDTPYISKRIAEQFPARSMIGLPLIAGKQKLGAALIEFERLHQFTPDEIARGEQAAGQIALAIARARLLEQVQENVLQLQSLSRRLVEVQEEERRAIGRELHDEIGQALTGLKIILEMAPRLPPESASAKLQQAQSLLSELIERVSRLTLELRPPMLDDLGLLPAILWHLDRYTRQTNIQVDFKHAGIEAARFSKEIETAGYRIVQESLTNIARHAGVERAALRLTAGGGEMKISIADEGRGFDPAASLAKGRGLAGMRERVRLLGGEFTVVSAAGQGTRLEVKIPLREESSNQ